MKMKSTLAAASMAIALSFSASAKMLTTETAKEIVQPFYTYLSNPLDTNAAEKAREAFDPAWQSYYSNEGSKGLDGTIQGIAGIGKLIPDLNWEIKEVKVAGNTVIVRGEATGTPAGDFFGVPYSGKSFKIMSIDLHTIENGKVVQSYHIEDWASAMKQLVANK